MSKLELKEGFGSLHTVHICMWEHRRFPDRIPIGLTAEQGKLEDQQSYRPILSLTSDEKNHTRRPILTPEAPQLPFLSKDRTTLAQVNSTSGNTISQPSQSIKQHKMDEPPPQNLTTPTTDQPVLIITSHSHRRPLSRPPSLKFDLRKVSNPPKHIRDAYDGRSKRLREHMMHMKDFQELLDAAKKSVQEEMAVVLMRDGEGKSQRCSSARCRVCLFVCDGKLTSLVVRPRRKKRSRPSNL